MLFDVGIAYLSITGFLEYLHITSLQPSGRSSHGIVVFSFIVFYVIRLICKTSCKDSKLLKKISASADIFLMQLPVFWYLFLFVPFPLPLFNSLHPLIPVGNVERGNYGIYKHTEHYGRTQREPCTGSGPTGKKQWHYSNHKGK